MLNSIYQHRALEHLKRLPKFKHPLPKHQPHYEAVKDVVTKVAGSDKPKIVTNFLRSQFPSLRAREASWRSIFDQADQVSSNITSSTYTYEMKKLLDKFTHNQAADFFYILYPESKDIELLNRKVLQDLKLLCNHIEDL